MDGIDLNLLAALDALLTEGSVTGAARRLGLSASAMSRTLGRLRAATGDPLLVRAGRGLVPTPHAIALRDRVHLLSREVQAVLSPQDNRLDLQTLDRTFTIRANEGFVGLFSAPLVAAVRTRALHVSLRFAPKPAKDAGPLREGMVDLEIGVLGTFAPEVRTHLMFRDRFIGAVRVGHPLLSAPITPQSYAVAQHVVVSRKGSFTGPVDDALEALGLRRDVIAVVPGGFPDAMRIASQSESRGAHTPVHVLATLSSHKVWLASNCLSPRPRLLSRRCGIPAWKPILRINGCATQSISVCRPSAE